VEEEKAEEEEKKKSTGRKMYLKNLYAFTAVYLLVPLAIIMTLIGMNLVASDKYEVLKVRPREVNFAGWRRSLVSNTYALTQELVAFDNTTWKSWGEVHELAYSKFLYLDQLHRAVKLGGAMGLPGSLGRDSTQDRLLMGPLCEDTSDIFCRGLDGQLSIYISEGLTLMNEDTVLDSDPLFQFLRNMQDSLFDLLNVSMEIFKVEAARDTATLKSSLTWIFLGGLALWLFGVAALSWQIQQIQQSLVVMIKCTFSIPRQCVTRNEEFVRHLLQLGMDLTDFFDLELYGQGDTANLILNTDAVGFTSSST